MFNDRKLRLGICLQVVYYQLGISVSILAGPVRAASSPRLVSRLGSRLSKLVCPGLEGRDLEAWSAVSEGLGGV